MTKKRMVCAGLILLVLLLPSSVSPQNRERRGRLRVTVVGGPNSAPINGAEVMVKSTAAARSFAESAPTNSNGVASISEVPFGPVVIQATARGWRPSGDQLLLAAEKLNVVIRLEQVGPGTEPSPFTIAPSSFSSFVSPLREIRTVANVVRRSRQRSRRGRRHH